MSDWYELTSKRKSEWPSPLRVDFIVILPILLGCEPWHERRKTERETERERGYKGKTRTSLILFHDKKNVIQKVSRKSNKNERKQKKLRESSMRVEINHLVLIKCLLS